MLWLMAALLALATPVRLEVQAAWSQTLTAELLCHIWGVPLRRRLQLSGTGQAQRMLVQVEDRPPVQPPQEQLRRMLTLLGTLLRTDRARRSLARAVRLYRLDAQISVALGDASSTARAAGLAAGFAQLLSRRRRKAVRIRIQPDFLHGQSRFEGRCIIFFHLGSLLPAAAMALTAALLEAREHRPPPRTEEV